MVLGKKKKIGRNDPCWCESGIKFKKCHGRTKNTPVDIFANYGSFGGNPYTQTLKKMVEGNLPQKDDREILAKIKAEKQAGTRPLPSSKLISVGENPRLEDRIFLLDACASLVDENWAGRSEMCIFFAALLRHGLSLLGHEATVEIGRARYLIVDGKNFEWDHAWIRTASGDIVDGNVDGNVDSFTENPMVPEGIESKPYWGPPDKMPKDREFLTQRVLIPERETTELGDEIVKWKADLEKEIKGVFPKVLIK